jgi:1,4-alpha-glucan branching enzyme
VQSLVRDLNRVYRVNDALWAIDADPSGFLWLEPNDAENNVVAFCRLADPGRSDGGVLACVANLSPVPREGYRVGLPRAGRWLELLNTDAAAYGGGNVGNLGGVDAETLPWHGQPFSASLTLPPLGVVWLAPDGSSPSSVG